MEQQELRVVPGAAALLAVSGERGVLLVPVEPAMQVAWLVIMELLG